jgi:SAM-dependent MidA family methyltransferase
MGTLMCHYRHHAHDDALLYPGLQDITAHVNFTDIATAAVRTQLDILGYTNQAAFLLGCGLMELLTPEHNTQKEKVLQNNAVHKLTSPTEMGELFKVIALGRKFEEPLRGFSLSDKRYSL